jgi:hypothetical protein
LARSERTWRTLACGPLTAPAGDARELFSFAGAWAPSPSPGEAGWGVRDGARLVGALLLERAGSSAMLHGPVVVAPEGAGPDDALEVAAQLLAEAVKHAGSVGLVTLFARPQGLDRLWVRSGFIPVPEAELPAPLRGRPGIGLFAWRGGSALWSAAGREASRTGSARR